MKNNVLKNTEKIPDKKRLDQKTYLPYNLPNRERIGLRKNKHPVHFCGWVYGWVSQWLPTVYDNNRHIRIRRHMQTSLQIDWVV